MTNEKYEFKRFDYNQNLYKINGLEHDKNKGIYKIANLNWEANSGEAYRVKGLDNAILFEYIEEGREGEFEGLIFSLVTESKGNWKARELMRTFYAQTKNLKAIYHKESNEIEIKYNGWRERALFWGYRDCDFPEPQPPKPENFDVKRRIKLED